MHLEQRAGAFVGDQGYLFCFISVLFSSHSFFAYGCLFVLSVCFFFHMYISVVLYMCVYDYAFINVGVCIFVYIYVCVFVYVCIYIYVCLYMCIYVYVRVLPT